MARVSFQPTPPARFASTLAKRWGPTLGIWGVGAGTRCSLLIVCYPGCEKGFSRKYSAGEVLCYHIGNYYEDKTPASDKPF